MLWRRLHFAACVSALALLMVLLNALGASFHRKAAEGCELHNVVMVPCVIVSEPPKVESIHHGMFFSPGDEGQICSRCRMRLDKLKDWKDDVAGSME